MAESDSGQRRGRASLDERVKRLNEILAERGEDGAKLVRTWISKKMTIKTAN